MNDLYLECHACRRQFQVAPDDLRPHHGVYIQGNRPPEYVVGCPVCQAKNVMRLPENSPAGAPIVGQSSRKR